MSNYRTYSQELLKLLVSRFAKHELLVGEQLDREQAFSLENRDAVLHHLQETPIICQVAKQGNQK